MGGSCRTGRSGASFGGRHGLPGRAMKQRYLEITFRKGKPFAAYLYLPRAAGAKAARTLDGGHGVRIDLDERGGLLGLEITAPSACSVRGCSAQRRRVGAAGGVRMDERDASRVKDAFANLEPAAAVTSALVIPWTSCERRAEMRPRLDDIGACSRISGANHIVAARRVSGGLGARAAILDTLIAET